MNWNIHQLFLNPSDLFNANIYYPYKNSLAFSETFLTSSVLSIIPMWLLKEPIVAVNFTLISSIFMVGFFTFILAFYLTKNFWPSLISGLLIIFSPLFLDKKPTSKCYLFSGFLCQSCFLLCLSNLLNPVIFYFQCYFFFFSFIIVFFRDIF
ncbi:MAG: hypothetical protein A2171_00985 [Candidatus Levybacteria bacterium RBG_13_35_9]|nr:MAG: hypothetical protein A2171_00985 [Candidatus Levybacteria bacterium RBG_13_35_9]